MRIARVVGRLTLSKAVPELKGARWILATPYSLEGLRGDASGVGEEFVIYDELGVSEGQTIAVSEGAEAAGPFHPDQKPIDAYCAAILDSVEVQP